MTLKELWEQSGLGDDIPPEDKPEPGDQPKSPFAQLFVMFVGVAIITKLLGWW